MNSQERRTILVVDDSPVDVAVLSEILRQEYSVLGAANATSALEILHSSKVPDLILLDIMMSGLDGLEFCRQIRADPVTRRIPVIFVTAKDTDEDEAAGFAAGGVDYVVKPVNPHLLRARVKTHVELKMAREGLEAQNEILKENARLREDVEQVSRHDLKNPLMVIMNIPGVLLRQPSIGAEEAKWLQMIQDAARRMLEMINMSIDMFKMEKGTYNLRPEPVDALAVVRQIADAMARIACDGSLSFDFAVEGQPAEAAGAFVVSAEEPLLYTLLSNLMRNAVEASPAGGRVSLSFSAGASGVIGIHNAGAIPASILGRFFQKFATAGKQGGTGLGAYSAKLIARTLGGTIAFQSSEEAGTTITVSLPLARAEA
jgi:signal transduction histidine kinase